MSPCSREGAAKWSYRVVPCGGMNRLRILPIVHYLLVILSASCNYQQGFLSLCAKNLLCTLVVEQELFVFDCMTWTTLAHHSLAHWWGGRWIGSKKDSIYLLACHIVDCWFAI